MRLTASVRQPMLSIKDGDFPNDCPRAIAAVSVFLGGTLGLRRMVLTPGLARGM
jgi:hypothetical protein